MMPNSAHFYALRVAMFILLGCPAMVSAQADGKIDSLRSTTCLDRIPPNAFKRVVVYAYIDLQDSVSDSFAQSADNFLQEVVNRTQHRFGTAADRLPVGEPAVNWRGVDVPLHLVAYKNGRIGVAHRDSVSATAAAASLLARALDSSMFGQIVWTADSARDSVRFDIAVVRPVFDSVGHADMPKHNREAVPVFSVLAPWEEHARAKPGQTPPAYPYGARRGGYEGTVLLQFVVDSTGHAVMPSVRDLMPKEKPRWTRRDSSAYRSFLEETTRALSRIEFIPARIGGCPVPQLVQMPFAYSFR